MLTLFSAGTSLSGLNADQVAEIPAQKSLKGGRLGTIIINLQQTRLDGLATLRIFERSDHVLTKLLQILQLPNPADTAASMPLALMPRAARAVVPYDNEGRLVPPGCSRSMLLDLRPGSTVRITGGHNIQVHPTQLNLWPTMQSCALVWFLCLCSNGLIYYFVFTLSRLPTPVGLVVYF